MRFRRASLAGGAVLATACAFPHSMERLEPVPAAACREVAPLGAPGAGGSSPPQLVWYHAPQERDVALAARWCATVGPVVVRLDPPVAGAWQEGEPLHVVSWNLWIGGGDLFRFLAEELGVPCGAGGAPPFVLLLQEVWRYSEALPEVRGSSIVPFTIDPRRSEGEDADIEDPDIAEVARRCGLSLLYVPSGRNGPDSGSRPNEDMGTAILSNLTLTDPLALDLPLEGGRKVAVAATVAAPGGASLRVVSAHLDVASTLVRTVLSGNQTRVRQALGLVDALDLAERDGHDVDATVVGADLNTWSGYDSTLDHMRAAFPESPAWDGLPTRGGFPTDHVLFRSDDASGLSTGRYERIEARYGSDHHARRLYLLSRSGPR